MKSKSILVAVVAALRSHPSRGESVAISAPSASVVLSSSFPDPDTHSQFESWMVTFGRTYPAGLGDGERASRKLVWLENHERIRSHNEGGSSYTMGHNDFSDMTGQEFRRRFYLGEYSPGVARREPSGGRYDGRGGPFGAAVAAVVGSSSSRDDDGDGDVRSSRRRGMTYAEEGAAAGLPPSLPGHDDDDGMGGGDGGAPVANVPESKDWREEGAVTSVKNQWFCGACWAFSAVGAIEGARYIKTGNLTELSMQQLIDCDMTDLGCGGGLMDQAFAYDEDAVGLCALSEYPFAYHRHWFYGCSRYMPYCTPLDDTRVQKFMDVNKTEADLAAAIATQPVSVAVVAADDWQFYSGGIYDGGCANPDDIDHGILAVGYGHYDPKEDPDAAANGVGGDYWLVKNSWGEGWGLDGYMRLARGVGNEAEGGTSCILTMSSRPVLKVED